MRGIIAMKKRIKKKLSKKSDSSNNSKAKIKGNTSTKTKSKKKPLTANQKAFQKEHARLQRQIKRMEKRGYEFPKKIKDLLEKPKRITSNRIEKLKALTSKSLYSHAKYVNQTTGEVVKGTVGRKQERTEASKKGWATRKAKKQAKTKGVEIPKGEPTEPEKVSGRGKESQTGKKFADGVAPENDFYATVINKVYDELNGESDSAKNSKSRRDRETIPNSVDKIIDFIEQMRQKYGDEYVADILEDIPNPTHLELVYEDTARFKGDFLTELKNRDMLTDDEYYEFQSQIDSEDNSGYTLD